MNIHILFLLTLIISFNNIHSVIINGIELIHPKKNSHMYLFGDLHEIYFMNDHPIVQNLSSTDVIASLLQESNKQNVLLNSFAQHLLRSNKNRSYIITETPEVIIENFIKYGQNVPQNPTLAFLPYAFLQQAAQGATTENERFNFLNQNIINIPPTEKSLGALYIPFHENLRWVIGDRFRNFILTRFYVKDEIGSSSEQNKSLSQEFIDLKLGILKKYILDWQRIFKINQFDDTCGDQLLNIIDIALQNGFSESDHVISLFEQLDQAQLTTRDESSINIRRAVGKLMMDFEWHIFDCELEHYIKYINKSPAENTIVVLAGAGHIQRLSKSLQQQGYFHKKIPSGIKIGLYFDPKATLAQLCNQEERKKFNSNLEQLLNRIVHPNQQQKSSSRLSSYIPYAPAVVAGSIGLLSLMSNNSKAKIVAGASIIATPLMALAAHYYQTASKQ